jgi:hypothetical protein
MIQKDTELLAKAQKYAGSRSHWVNSTSAKYEYACKRIELYENALRLFVGCNEKHGTITSKVAKKIDNLMLRIKKGY